MHKLLVKSYKNVKTIIIPRHIDRVNEILISLNKMGLKTQVKTFPKFLSGGASNKIASFNNFVD